MDEKRLQEVEVKLYTPDLAIVQEGAGIGRRGDDKAPGFRAESALRECGWHADVTGCCLALAAG